MSTYPHRAAARFVMRILLLGSAAMLLLSVWTFVSPGNPALGLGSSQGTATIKDAGGSVVLTSGDSATTFTLRLPSNAACPGDSTNDGYRWQTYMVPSSVNPNSLTFNSAGPITASGFHKPLFTTAGDPVVNEVTADKVAPATTGQIVNIPDMNFSVYAAGDIPADTYNIGIGCTLGAASSTQLSSFWNTAIVVTSSASDTGPAHIAWHLDTTTTSSSTSSSTSTSSTSSTSTSSTSTSSTSTSTSSTSTTSTSTTSTSSTSTTSTSTTSTTADPAEDTVSTVGPSALGLSSTTTSDPGAVLASTESAGSGGGSGSLAFTGSRTTSLLAWAFVFIVLGRINLLLARRPVVLESSDE